MKKNGFTLVELISVIVILGLLIVVVMPAITTLLSDTNEKVYESKVKEIESAALEYGTLIKDDIKTSENQCKKIPLSEMISRGLIMSESKNKDEIINPVDDSKMDGAVCLCYYMNTAELVTAYTENKNDVCTKEYVEEIKEPVTQTESQTTAKIDEEIPDQEETTTTTTTTTTTQFVIKECADNMEMPVVTFKAEDGTVQEYTVPCSGLYTLTAWGAGGNGSKYSGNKGSKAEGTYELTAGEKIYIYLGLKENVWNGGGACTYTTNNPWGATIKGGIGSGATDFRLVKSTASDKWSGTASLQSRIVTAGGGGGYRVSVGRKFNGATALSATADTSGDLYNAYKATTSEVSNGVLGQGSSCVRSYSELTDTGDRGWGVSGGGGGGYYGGKTQGYSLSGTYDNILMKFQGMSSTGTSLNNWVMINGNRMIGVNSNSYNGTSKVQDYTYNGIEYKVKANTTSIVTGIYSGNGKATIQYNSKLDCEYPINQTWTFNSKAEAQEFSVPCSGTYAIEAIGAGGDNKYNSNTNGSKAYAEFAIIKGAKLYAYVGSCNSLFNGAGQGGCKPEGLTASMVTPTKNGCGATDVRVIKSTASDGWSGEDSLKSRIITAGGGAGNRTSYGVVNNTILNTSELNHDTYSSNYSRANTEGVLGQGASCKTSTATISDNPSQKGYGASGGAGGGYYGGYTGNVNLNENSYTVFYEKDYTKNFGVTKYGTSVNGWIVLNSKYVAGASSKATAGTSNVQSFVYNNREFNLKSSRIETDVTSQPEGKVIITYKGAALE